MKKDMPESCRSFKKAVTCSLVVKPRGGGGVGLLDGNVNLDFDNALCHEFQKVL